MKTREEIERERNKLMVVCQEDSPVPKEVRSRAMDLCHTLTWVLEDDTEINPYNVFAGCCCLPKSPAPKSTKECTLGVDMCLCPSYLTDVAPEIPPEDPTRPRGRVWTRPETSRTR